MSAAEKLEVIPTKTGFIIRLIVYLFLFFPLFIVWVWIGTEEIKKSETGLGSEIAAWFFMLVLLFVLLILDFIENIWATAQKTHGTVRHASSAFMRKDEEAISSFWRGGWNCRCISAQHL